MDGYHLELAKALLLRMRNQGVNLPAIQNRFVPPLPDGWEYHPSDNGHAHTCDGEGLVELPLILVADIEVPCYDGYLQLPHGIRYRAEHRFDPYWLVGVRVIHDFVPYPPEPFRAVNPIEAACIFAQHPRLGSVKSHIGFGSWGHRSVQAYRCPERKTIVIGDPRGSAYNHHAAFARYLITSGSPTIATYNPDPLPRKHLASV